MLRTRRFSRCNSLVNDNSTATTTTTMMLMMATTMTATNPTMRLHFTPLYFDNRITPNDINNDDDNSEATKGSADVDCQVDGDSSELCKEYDEKMEALQSIMKQIKPELDNVQALATELRNVKIGAPESKPKPQSPELMAAIESAQAVSQEKGESSVEARLAWETVEEVASAPRTENAMGGMLTDECLVETAADACAALEELNRALEVTDSNKE